MNTGSNLKSNRVVLYHSSATDIIETKMPRRASSMFLQCSRRMSIDFLLLPKSYDMIESLLRRVRKHQLLDIHVTNHAILSHSLPLNGLLPELLADENDW